MGMGTEYRGDRVSIKESEDTHERQRESDILGSTRRGSCVLR